ncbi:unnamed protein product, partial [Scytosiphon promiscuus]
DRYALGLDLDFVQTAPDQTETLSDRVSGFERNAIATALTTHNGRLKETYEALGLSRKSLYEKMQKYSLNREDFGVASNENSPE